MCDFGKKAMPASPSYYAVEELELCFRGTVMSSCSVLPKSLSLRSLSLCLEVNSNAMLLSRLNVFFFSKL